MSNNLKRVLSAIVGSAIILAGLLVNKWLFGAMMLFILCAMLAEYFKMTMGTEYKYPRLIAIFAACVLFILVFCHEAFGLSSRYVALAIVPVVAVMVMSLYVKDKTDFGKFSNVYTGLLYIAAPVALSNILAFENKEFSGILLLSFLFIIWASDIGAFILGCALGQKYGPKLFPSISPKKSWVGAAGGFLFAILTGLILYWTGLFDFPWYHCVILAAIMNVASVYGDLFESQWKRVCDVKDSGNIIPGHGGMLDRFDSSLFAIPVGALYLAIFGLI